MSGGGDTPLNKHWKYEFNGGYYLIGILNDEDYEYWTTDLFAVNTTDQLAYMFNSQGQAVTNINLTDTVKNNVLSALQSFYGFTIEEFNLIAGRITAGQYVEDWEQYQKIN